MGARGAHVPALILAAGGSRRLGRPKQLVQIDGEPLLARMIRIAQAAGAEPVFVVLGAASSQIEDAIELDGVSVIQNSAWQEGIASSIRAGLEAIEHDQGEAEGVLILACDQPRLDVPHVEQLLTTFRQHGGLMNVASRYAGTRGIPAIFSRGSFRHLAELRGDKGARSLLVHPGLPAVELPFPGGEFDIDTPEDLKLI